MNGASERARRLLGDSVLCGLFLGMVAGIIVMSIGVLVHPEGADTILALIFVVCAAEVGAQLGAFAGLVTGSVMCPIVRCGEERCGARCIARVVPIVALAVTVPLATAAGLQWTTMPAVVVAVVALLTIPGASHVAHRYLERETQ